MKAKVINVQGTVFAWKISSRRKNIAIVMDPRHGLIVKSPGGVPEKALIQFIETKLNWVKKKELLLAPKNEAGQYFFLGSTYKVNVEKSEQNNVIIESGVIRIEAINPSNKYFIDTTLSLWEVDFLERFVNEIINKYFFYFHQYKLTSLPTVLIGRQKGKWGECRNRNEIRINKDLIKFPQGIIEYVVIHEMCHMLEMNHSARFYKHLENLIPDWKRRKKLLSTLQYKVLN